MSSNSMKNVRPADFFARCLTFCFAGLAVAASAQTQPSGQNPGTNGPIVVPPSTQPQPQPRPVFQPQPSQDIWDRWGIQKVSEDDDWTRHFRIGAMVGLNISANFGVKNTIAFSGNNAAQGNYDDGYVHPSPNGPYTSDWGYTDSGQYIASLHRLVMYQTTSFTSDSGNGASVDSGGKAFAGFDMAYGGNIWDWKSARIGWEFGFGLLPVSISENLSMIGSINRNAYAFDTSGIDNYAPFPGPGSHGTGGSGFISGTPVPTPGIPSTDQITDQPFTGSYKLDVMLYTFRLGPTVYWDLNEDWGLSASAGPALGLVSGSLKYSELVGASTTPNTGQIDGTDIVYGGYVNAMLMYHIEEHGDLYLGAQFMSLGDATISGGGREGRLNLGGQVYITAGINWPF
jgi:hypothetical protein